MGNFWSDLLRNIIGFFDVIIYGFIDNVYNTFTNVASYALINNEIIETFTQRIYIIIGIFMLFKMAFSLINYFVDPDKITDSKSGFGNLVQRVIISLVLLVLVPTVFNIAFYAQTIILNENILANIILGGSYGDVDSTVFVDTYENAGKKMAFSVLSAFMAPKDTSVLTMTEKEIETEFKGEDKEIESYKKYLEARDNNNISGLVGWNGIKNNESDDGQYIYNYMAGLSTIAGIIVLLTLLSFCVDIGIRTVKLAFLQLIAPIPVLSYIDVNKGKDVFNKWVKECFSSYLEVFLRLLAIYFVIFIISLITQNGFTLYTYTIKNGEITTTEVPNVDLFAQALIIIGLLIFAGQAPKLIGDLFGVKLGDFSLNPLKKINSSPFAAGVVGGALGFGAGTFANSANLYKNIKKDGLKKTFFGDGTHVNKNGESVPDNWYHSLKKIGRTTGTVVGSTAGTRAMMKGFTGGGKGSMWSNVKTGLKGSNDARYRRSQYISAGYDVGQRLNDKIDSAIGYKNKYSGVGKMDEDVQKLTNRAAEFDTRETRAREAMIDLETKYANQYKAEAFDLGFYRDNDGNLAFQTDKYSEYKTDYEKYMKYIDDLNKDRTDEDQVQKIMDKALFDEYFNLEQNVNYYNTEHEKLKKEIKAKEKIINTKKGNKE